MTAAKYDEVRQFKETLWTVLQKLHNGISTRQLFEIRELLKNDVYDMDGGKWSRWWEEGWREGYLAARSDMSYGDLTPNPYQKDDDDEE